MEVSGNIGVILLAAGASARMGTSKQMLYLDGEPMLARAARIAVAVSGTNAVVVLGANADNHIECLRNISIQTVTNTSWSSGMGASIKQGMRWIIEHRPATSAALIMVCDQPAVSDSHLRALIVRHSGPGTPVVASAYAGTIGVPALFDTRFLVSC
ncbi:MAG: nucleotidyltransferase family protein [Bacteroidia bacterium]|nr:nucleotidyltransferase family protein [Bacteroidia bacterium]